MPRKTSKRKMIKKRRNVSNILFFLPIIFLAIIFIGGYCWYRSRSIPDLSEQNQVTMLPSDMRNVLGATISPYTKPEVSIRIPIFMYHYVEYVHNDPARQNLTVSPNVLIAQIETLKNAGYTFITPNDLTLVLSNKKKLTTKLVMLSFDDGYMDFYTDVFPIIQKEQVKVIAYIVPSFLDRPNYMFTFQLKEIARSPLIEIGAHTMDHYALAGVNIKTATYEIAQSKKTLQDLLHLPITSFAYPYGSFDQSAIQITKDAGFLNAVSTIPGIVQTPENEYFLYRLRPGYRSGQGLLNYLNLDTFSPW